MKVKVNWKELGKQLWAAVKPATTVVPIGAAPCRGAASGRRKEAIWSRAAGALSRRGGTDAERGRVARPIPVSFGQCAIRA